MSCRLQGVPILTLFFSPSVCTMSAKTAHGGLRAQSAKVGASEDCGRCGLGTGSLSYPTFSPAICVGTYSTGELRLLCRLAELFATWLIQATLYIPTLIIMPPLVSPVRTLISHVWVVLIDLCRLVVQLWMLLCFALS